MAKTYTTVVDKAGGDTFTEAMWDTYIRDNVNNLIVPPACRVRKSASQVLTTSVEAAITWDIEDYDTDSMHDNATNNNRITCPTVGIYVVNVLFFYDTNVTGIRMTNMYINAAIAANYVGRDYTGAPAGYYLGSLTCIKNTTAGSDYFQVTGYQSSGGNLNFVGGGTEENFEAIWVGRTS